MKKLLIVTLILLSIASCTKEVKIDIPGYEEQLVIDGRIETDMPPIILISKTKDIYSPTDMDAYLNSFVSGAVVTVSNGDTTVVLDEICTDNLPPGTEQMAADLFGIPVSELPNYHICAYTTFNTSIWGEVGKSYDLTVQFEGKTYTSTTKILQPTALNSVYWKQDEDAPQGFGFSWASLTDPAGQYDAYMWEVKRLDIGDDGQPKDAAFKATFAPVWDDEFINGTTFDFAFENPNNRDEDIPDEQKFYYGIGDTVVIKLSKLDVDVYEFLEKKYLQLQTTGNPFASPTAIPTNIKGGAQGVWAGYSPHFDTLICQ